MDQIHVLSLRADMPSMRWTSSVWRTAAVETVRPGTVTTNQAGSHPWIGSLVRALLRYMPLMASTERMQVHPCPPIHHTSQPFLHVPSFPSCHLTLNLNCTVLSDFYIYQFTEILMFYCRFKKNKTKPHTIANFTGKKWEKIEGLTVIFITNTSAEYFTKQLLKKCEKK